MHLIIAADHSSYPSLRWCMASFSRLVEALSIVRLRGTPGLGGLQVAGAAQRQACHAVLSAAYGIVISQHGSAA